MITEHIESPYYSLKGFWSNSFGSTVREVYESQKDKATLRMIKSKVIEDRNRNLPFGQGFHEIVGEPQNHVWRRFTAEERIKAMKMKKSLSKAFELSTDINLHEFLKNVKKEHELYFTSKSINAKCKIKVDVLDQVYMNALHDWKTTVATSQEEVIEQFMKYNIYKQSAFYLDCPILKRRGITKFYYWFVSKKKPHEVFNICVDAKSPHIEHGRLLYMEEYAMYKKIKSQNNGIRNI